MALNKRKVLDAARKFAQKGAKAKALKEYNKLLKEDPRDAKLLLEVGDAYRRWGQNEEAIAQYGKVAQQYRQDGFDARAVAVFKQILNLDPKNYAAYVSLAELYQRMGLDSEAVGALQTAADGYHKEGRKSEALELLRQMAGLDPTNTTSRLKVAELLRQEGMEDEAIVEYDAVVAELENQQDRDQAITVLERMREIRPDHVPTLTSLVRHLMASGELDRAEPLAVHAREQSGDTAQHELLLELYAQMGNDAKLAEATRGLAACYRERGDEEKARELMQRLPAEEMASSNSRLAVDVSEIDEPDLGDEELLGDDEPFLSLDDESDAADSEDSPFSLDGDASSLDFSTGEPTEVPAAPAPAATPEALPEGDPDQLLAEANVYLRYGKREQAIASLRGVLAQDANHRGALEKLGEAYADDGRTEEAVDSWMKAAEQVRAAGDAEGLSVLKDRIAALDPAKAAQVAPLADVGGSPEASLTVGFDEFEHGDVLEDAPAIELDLEVAVEAEADSADEAEGSGSSSGMDFGAEDEDFEIELDEDSVTFDPALRAPAEEVAAPSPTVETTTPDFAVSAVDAEVGEEDDDDSEFEFEIDTDELSFGADDSDGPSEKASSETEGIAAAPAEADSASAAARISEEIEEAEFYIAQEMFDEAETLLRRVLAAVPNHPSALLRLGEVAASRGATPDAVAPQEDLAADSTSDFEITARFDDDSATFEGAPEADDAFEVELDMDDEFADADADVDVDVDVDDDAANDADEDEFEVVVDVEPEPADLFADVDDDDDADDDAEPAAAAAEPIAPAQDDGDGSPVEAPAPMDAGESFDLREALADVLAEDEPPVPDPNGDSGVRSTVGDGFESIFSDFKKGVTATLDAGDFDTRYDLGIAYREMGLYEDAIGEFRVCLDSSERRFDSLYLMGLCARDLGRPDDAVSHFEQALALPDLPDDRMAGVYFDLSLAEEAGGNLERASASLARVIELEPDFPGAAERLEALAQGESSAPEVGQPGEVFESFDDLFAGDDENDEDGDSAVAAAVSSETFESFDDVVSEAEAVLEEAELVEEASVADSNADSDSSNEASKSSRKGGRKKISFV